MLRIATYIVFRNLDFNQMYSRLYTLNIKTRRCPYKDDINYKNCL